MTEFTPIESLIGGLMIGASATLLMYGIGRIAGISGVVGTLLTRQPAGETAWRIAFIVGLLIAAALTFPLAPALKVIGANLPMQADIAASPWLVIVAGVLVGYGARLGSGCTSGHGVCGIGRLSKRSIVATMTFMVTAALTVYLSKWIAGA